MKKKVLAYFSGVFATVLVLTMVTTALAASGKATFNFVNVSLRGEQKIAAGADITVANGQKVPSSILYTDEKGGKTQNKFGGERKTNDYNVGVGAEQGGGEK